MKKIVGLIVLILGLLCVTEAMATFDPIWPAESYYVTCMYYYSDGSGHGSHYSRYQSVDIAGGGDVYACEAGTVTQIDINGNNPNVGFGNTIYIVHDDGMVSMYAHLASINVSEDQRVSKGQVIGVQGNTSNGKYPNMGVHLHFEMSDADPMSDYLYSKYKSSILFESNVYSNNAGLSNSFSQWITSEISENYTYSNGWYQYSGALANTSSLDINTWVDNTEVINPTQIGTIEVYIDNVLTADTGGGTADFYRTDLPIGSTYEVKYKPSGKYRLSGVDGIVKGTISSSPTEVKLYISSSGYGEVITSGKEYIIATAANQSSLYYLDIPGSETNAAHGTKVSIAQSTTGVLPRYDVWKLIYNSDGYYSIMQASGNKVLDVCERALYPQADIVIASQNASGDEGNQRWAIKDLGNGKYTLFAKHSGMALDLNGASVTNPKVQQYSGNGSVAQQWLIIPYKYTVSYNANGGSNAPDSQEKIYNQALTLTSSKPTKEGYTFLWWNTKSDGSGTTYRNEDAYTANANLSLFAIWGKNGQEMTSGAGKTILDGDYIIKSSKNTDYYLDIKGSDEQAAEGKNVQIYSGANGTIHSRDTFSIQYLNNGFYSIKQRGTNMALTVADGTTEWRGNIQVNTYTGATSQQWSISEIYSDSTRKGFKIQSRCNGLSLDISGGTMTDGTNVAQWESVAGENRSWVFIPYQPAQTIEDGRYLILCDKNPDFELDIDGDSYTVEEGKNVQIWNDTSEEFKEYSNSQYNTFDVAYIGDGYYKLTHHGSGKALSVADNSTVFCTNICMKAYTGAKSQQWAIIESGDAYCILSRSSGYSLNVQSAEMSNGQNVMQYGHHGDSHEMWHFVLYDTEPPTVSNTDLPAYSATSATFSVTATDNVAVDHVNVRVWHGDYEANKPNAESYPATQSGDIWAATVPLTLSDGDSWYMYAEVYDAAGNHTDSGLAGLKQFTLSFDAGDGAACDEQFRTMIYTSLTQNGVRSYLTTYGELPEASLASHSLDGWFFENGEPVTPEILVTNKEDHTLYAHWTLADDEIPVVSHGVLSNITEDSATVTVTAADNTEVERVTVEVHPGLWKGTNPTVFDARKVEDVWVCDFTFDFDESAMQRFYVDAYDVAGNKSYSSTISSDVYGYFVKTTVTYDANGGACDTAEAEKITACIDNRVEGGTSYPNLMGEMPEPVLENNTFLGWFDQTGCVITMNSPVMFSQDTILTAHWLKDYTKGKATIGTNGSLITVSYTDPCIISESDDGVAYRRVIPSQGEQGYTFQTSKSQVAVVIAGDIDLNAIVNGKDYISLKSYKSTPLEGVNAAAGDLNNDAKIDLLDVALYRRSNITASSHPAYQPLSWYPLSPVYENTLILPEALTTIENEAFRGIEGVNIVVPNTVTDIAERAFGSYVLIICPDDSYATEFAEDESIPHMESL